MDNGLNNDLIKEINENREFLFQNVDKRINDTREQEELNKRLYEIREKEKRRLNTEKTANAIIALIYKILTEAKYKTSGIDVKTIDELLGKPYDSVIGDSVASHYAFDDEGLTIYLNYSCEIEDIQIWGGTSFIETYNNKIDEDYLIDLLITSGIEYNRETREVNNDEECQYIEIVTIRVNRYTKNSRKGL